MKSLRSLGFAMLISLRVAPGEPLTSDPLPLARLRVSCEHETKAIRLMNNPG